MNSKLVTKSAKKSFQGLVLWSNNYEHNDRLTWETAAWNKETKNHFIIKKIILFSNEKIINVEVLVLEKEFDILVLELVY